MVSMLRKRLLTIALLTAGILMAVLIGYLVIDNRTDETSTIAPGEAQPELPQLAPTPSPQVNSLSDCFKRASESGASQEVIENMHKQCFEAYD